MKKIVQAVMMTMALAVAPLQASAGNSEVQNVMDDALYGAGVGALVGLGVMLVSSTPSSNWNYVTQGAGVGIIGGAVFGLLRTSKAFAEVEDGVIHLGVPTPEFALQTTDLGYAWAVKTDLIHGTY